MIHVRDHEHRLPLHCALEANCSMEVIQTLICCWPKSLQSQMKGGLLLLHFTCKLVVPQLMVIQVLVQGWPNAIHEQLLPLH